MSFCPQMLPLPAYHTENSNPKAKRTWLLSWKTSSLQRKWPNKKAKMKIDLPFSLLKAEQKAADIIEKFGIAAPEHIRLEDIAYAEGARIVEGELKGAAASLVRLGKKATIRIPANEKYQPRKRFSVAHELGHFVLGHGHSVRLVCTEANMHDWRRQAGTGNRGQFFCRRTPSTK